MSYPLETPKPRPPLPPPIRVHKSAFTPALTQHNNRKESDPNTLLYDLPSAPAIVSPQSSSAGRSPTSPTSASGGVGGRSGRAAGGGVRKMRPTPPPTSPSPRGRSVTPSGVAPSELELFAGYCRAWYFDQHQESGRLMTQTLATLPASQRAPFSRLQAHVRSAYHVHINARRTAEFNAHLSVTQPGGSLLPHNRASPQGLTARKERYERFDKFVRAWCTMGMPGTKPFFEALWATMRLQVVPRELGGAGSNRIQWEFDDAVFKEAAGKDFMLEAIDVLKGVLGFEEVASPKRLSTGRLPHRSPHANQDPLHSRSQSQPLPSDRAPQQHKQQQPPHSSRAPKRTRAPSDPFLDTPPAQSHGLLSHANGVDALDEPPPSPISPSIDLDDILIGVRDMVAQHTGDEEEGSLRVWTLPDLANPEILSLLKVFPPFISRRALPRFPAPIQRGPGDIEDVMEEERGEGKEVQFGTGSMWIGAKVRSDGWKGTWWSRVVSWCRKVFFCC